MIVRRGCLGFAQEPFDLGEDRGCIPEEDGAPGTWPISGFTPS
jgi:hypothetical protein